jgi:amino acid adenylation domain-containing protein
VREIAVDEDLSRGGFVTNLARATQIVHPPLSPAVAVGAVAGDHPVVLDAPGGGLLSCAYRTDVVDEAAANWLLHCVRATMVAFTTSPGKPLSTIDLTAGSHPAPELPGETEPVLLDSGHTLHEVIGRQVAVRPGAIAVTGEQCELTYRELWDAANVIAHRLRRLGAGPGVRIGVSLPRSPLLIATLLGVLKAGAAYVPLVPGNPVDRLDYVAEDAGVRLLVTDGPWPGPTALPVLTVDETVLRQREPEPARGSADDEAYLIYTSGSTGKPKGVVVTHRRVCALLDSARRFGFGFGPDDVWALFHTYSWDFSVWEIFGCLTTGGRLVMVSEETSRDPYALHALIGTQSVTVLNQTPSVFAQLVAVESELPAHAPRLPVRQLIFSGEALDMALMLRWFERYPDRHCRVVNMYGITETTVACTWQPVTAESAKAESRSVGFAIPGWKVDVVDERMRRVPAGVPGEILLGGPGIVDGYYRRPELTAQKFLPDNGRHPGALWYRTGDRGRVLANGELEYLGRLDDQVKIRGHRVELGEIRTILLEDARVLAAAVVIAKRGSSAGDDRLDAYVVGTEIDRKALEERLRAALPDYMVPATITGLPELPVTPNGKLDAARLPEPERPAPTEAPAPPSTGMQRKVGDVWSDVLSGPIGLDDDLFLVGGNSMLAFTIVSRIRKAGLGQLAVRDLYRNRTIRALADFLEAAEPAETSAASA